MSVRSYAAYRFPARSTTARRRALRGTWLAVLAASALACAAPEPDAVIVVTIDTLRADHVGAYGGPAPTPTMDALAERGVVFEDTTASTPITLPSHASLFTGRYPTRNGVRNNGTFVVPDAEVTLAERLSDAGWSTAAVIASYPLHRRYGLDQGFDVYDDRFAPPGAAPDGVQPFFPERDAAAVTDRAIEIWNDLPEGKKFLWVHYFDPHAPYAPPPPFGGDDPAARYVGEVRFTDRELGRLLDALDLDFDRSVVVATSDHGEGLGEHDEKTHGVFVYQSTVRIPLIVRADGLLPAGARIATPVSIVDIAPTVLALLDLDELANVDGTDLRPVVEGAPRRASPVYAESFLPRYEYRASELRAVRDGALKRIEAPRPELYDLAQDPDETRDLSGGHPDEDRLVAALSEVMAAEDPGAADRAAATLDAASASRLRSLGYVSGGATAATDDEVRDRDPKDLTEFIARYDRAIGLLSMSRFDEAFELLGRLIGEQPDNPALRLQYAGGLLAARKLDACATELETIVELDPSLAAAWTMLGEVRGILGDAEASETAYAQAIALEPWSSEPRFQLGRMRASLGRFGAAAAAFVDALDAEPSDAEVANALVELRLSRGAGEAAIDELTALLERHPEQPNLLTARARVLLGAERLDEALRDLALAFDRAPSGGSTAITYLDALLRAERPGDAISVLDRLPSRTLPRAIEAEFRAGAWLGLGRAEEAIELLESTIAADPSRASLHVALGRAYEAADRPRDAAVAYRAALRAEPGNREAFEALRGLPASP